MKDPQIEPRMYRENREALGEKKTQNGFVVKKKSATVAYGVDTNTITRKQMFDMLPEIVETEYDKFVSPNVYNDLASLERKRNGKTYIRLPRRKRLHRHKGRAGKRILRRAVAARCGELPHYGAADAPGAHPQSRLHQKGGGAHQP